MERLQRLQAAFVKNFTSAGISAVAKEGPAKSVIHPNLGGGFPAQDSFDPKPEAPGEYRGPFNVVKTNTGEIFSEHFARMAKVPDKLIVVRSCNCRFPAGTKAIEYYPRTAGDTTLPNYGHAFFETFGRSSRGTICACESKPEPTLSQSLHLLVGQTVAGRVGHGESGSSFARSG